jgi:hypothetical protein
MISFKVLSSITVVPHDVLNPENSIIKGINWIVFKYSGKLFDIICVPEIRIERKQLQDPHVLIFLAEKTEGSLL